MTTDTILPGVVKAYLDAYNRMDVDALLACVTDDVRFENHSNASPESVVLDGKPALAELARQSLGVFREREQRVIDAVVSGDRVALRIAFRATIADAPPEGWTAGQALALHGSSFLTLRDGRIAAIVDLS